MAETDLAGMSIALAFPSLSVIYPGNTTTATYYNPFESVTRWACGADSIDGRCLSVLAISPLAIPFVFLLPFIIGPVYDAVHKDISAYRSFIRFGFSRWPWRLTIASSFVQSVALVVALSLVSNPQRGVIMGCGSAAVAWMLNGISLTAVYTKHHPLGDFHLAWMVLISAAQAVAGGLSAAHASTQWNTNQNAQGRASDVLITACGGLAITCHGFPAVIVLFFSRWFAPSDGDTEEAMMPSNGDSSTEAAFLLDRPDAAILPLLTPPDSLEGRAPVPVKAAVAPVDTASLVSRITFSWMSRLMAAGYKTPHEQEGLPPLPHDDRAESVHAAFEEAKRHYETKAEAKQTGNVSDSTSRPSITRILLRAHGRTFAAAALFKLTFDVLQFTGPVLLNALITFLDQSEGCAKSGSSTTCPPDWLGLTYVALLLLSSLSQTALLHQYFFRVFRFGQRLRSSIIVAVYRKSLRLALHSRQKQTVGTIINIMSTDAKRLQDFSTYGMMLLSGPWQIAISLTLLYQVVDVAVLGGVGVMLLLIPVNGLIARLSKRLQSRLMSIKDERVALTSEAISGIRLVKVNAWEDFFLERIKSVRDTELGRLRAYMLLQALSAVLWTALPLLVMLATFATYTYVHGGPPPAANTFTALSLFSLLRFPLAMMPAAISNLLEAHVSLQRIQSFLDSDDLQEDAVLRLPAAPPSAAPGTIGTAHMAIVVDNASFSWEPLGQASKDAAGDAVAVTLVPDNGLPAHLPVVATLQDISFSAQAGSLTCIVGAVGSGKTSLIHALLGELHKSSGSVNIAGGSVAYAAQQPFILNATLRANVLFGRPYRKDWYDDVIEACQLRHDIGLLPAGEFTEIGERGISLSGGQKARVALARAVYADSDVILLDDVLSAVDAHVGAAIFDRVLCGLLRGRTRVLVTHGLQYIPRADQILVMSGGRIAEVGTYAQLVEQRQGPLLCSLVETFRVEALQTVRDAISAGETAAADAAASIAASPPAAPVPAEGAPASTATARADFRPPHLGAIEGAEKKRQTDSSATAGLTSGFSSTSASNGSSGVFAAIASLGRGRQTTSETRLKGTVRVAVYGAYIRALGGWAIALALLLLFAASTACSLGASAYMSVWVSSVDETTSKEENLRFLGSYAGISAGSLAVLIVLRVGIALAGVSASRQLHNSLADAVLRLPVSFFDTTPIGRVLIRFSQDVYTADEQLPSTFSSFLNTFFSVAGTMILIGAVTPWFFLALVPLTAAYVWLQRYYVANARELQRLESISRSPIYAHFSETLAGISTIRAFEEEAQFAAKNAAQLDANVTAYFTGTSANRWLAVRLETLGALVTTASALFAVLARHSSNPAFPAFAGLSVSTALGITQSLNWLIRSSSDCETQVVSVERISEYAQLPSEESLKAPADGKYVTPPPGWPQRGAITVNGLRVRYRPTTPYVLHGIDLEIHPAEKIGCAGRTGSGKSSLIAALFRLPDVQEGTIEIDGVDISRIPLSVLRDTLSAIPQDAVLFSGTLRRNLDPLGEYTDAQLWSALEHVGMLTAVQRLPDGLEEKVAEGGAPFSTGQRQLLTVARALLRRRRIAVLDEASSAVDAESDAALLRAVRRELQGATVLTVAHRVHTILDSTRVLVLSDGRLREFDAPSSLLADPSSAFSGLLRENR